MTGYRSRCCYLPLQVACSPPGNLSIVVSTYRTDAGGYLQLAPSRVAGSGMVSSIELRQTPLVVGASACMGVLEAAWDIGSKLGLELMGSWPPHLMAMLRSLRPATWTW